MQSDKIRPAPGAVFELICADGHRHRQTSGDLLSLNLLFVDVATVQNNGVDGVGGRPHLLYTPGECGASITFISKVKNTVIHTINQLCNEQEGKQFNKHYTELLSEAQ